MQNSRSFSGLKRAAVFCFFLAAAVCRPAAAGEVVFGINPWDEASKMRAMCQPLVDYISEQTGVPIRISIPPTYDALVDDFIAGRTKLASVNSVTYLKIKRRMPNARYLATMVQGAGDQQQSHYIGYIITLKDAPYNSLDDLAGKIFGFVDVGSASGYKVPRAMMGLRGLSPDTFFKKYFFVGSHDELALAVKNKCVAAGATWDNSYKINTERFGKIFKIIEQTPPIPNDAWIAHPALPAKIAESVKGVLLTVSPTDKTENGRLALDPALGQPAEGFTELEADFYEKAAPLLLYEPGD